MSRILKCLATLGGAFALVVVLLLLSLPAAGAPRSGAGLARTSAAPVLVKEWGGKGSGDGQFNGPRSIAVDNRGFVYVTDGENDRVEKFKSDGTFQGKWGAFGTGERQFSTPNGIACSAPTYYDPNPYVYVVDTFNHRVEEFRADGTFVDQWGSLGSGPKQFLAPTAIAIGPSSGVVYVSDWANKRVCKFGADGLPLTTLPIVAGALATDSYGDLYAAVDGNPGTIVEFSPIGDLRAQWSSFGSGVTSTFTPGGIAVGSDGTVYVTDTSSMGPRVLEFSATGQPLTSWSVATSADTYRASPEGISVDATGDVYVVDGNNQCVKMYAPVPDHTAPVTTAQGADGKWHNEQVTLTFTGTDNPGGSGVAYTEARTENLLSAIGWQDWTKVDPSDPAVDVLAPRNHGNDGKTVVQYRSADKAGNVEDPPKEVTALIDTTPPTVVAVLPAKAVHGHRAVIDFKVTDRLSPKTQVQAAVFDSAHKAVRVANSGWLPIKGLNGWSFVCSLSPGRYTTAIKARDLAGNWSEWAQGRLTVK